jgi:hypothetical protein
MGVPAVATNLSDIRCCAKIYRMESADVIYAHNDNFVFRRIEDETILVPIKNHVGDLDSLFSLNPVGAFIWQQMDGLNTLADIHQSILSEFDVEPETAESDLLKFMSELHEIGAVQPVKEKGA